MSDVTEAAVISAPVPRQTITVREAISRLAQMEDMDAELCFSFNNSDPIPITDIADNGESQVVVSA